MIGFAGLCVWASHDAGAVQAFREKPALGTALYLAWPVSVPCLAAWLLYERLRK
jgi:hypothetical protein